MADTCVQSVDGKRGGRNSNALLQQLVTSGSEMYGVQRHLMIISSLLIILLKVAFVLLCLELSLISNVHVHVVVVDGTF